MVQLEVDHSTLEMLLERAIETKIPLFIWGDTGIGKSETVYRIAKKKAGELGREFVVWNKLSTEEKYKVAENPSKYYFLMDNRLSQVDPSDLRGLPNLNQKQFVEWKIPFWLYVASRPKSAGIIFFDEINLAPHSIQASAYQLILDRELGETAISDNVSLVAAGNRIEDKANVYELPRPLKTRFTHVTLSKPTISAECRNDWGEWALKNNVDMRIITFLIQRPSLLSPKVSETDASNAIPTPRGWAKFLSPMIKGVKDLTTLEKLASIAVGSGAALEFVSYLKLQKKINLDEILKNPSKASDVKEVDMMYALVSLVAEWYGNKPSIDKLDKTFQIAKYLKAEFATLLLHSVKMKAPNLFMSKDVLTKLKSWKDVADRIRKYYISRE